MYIETVDSGLVWSSFLVQIWRIQDTVYCFSWRKMQNRCTQFHAVFMKMNSIQTVMVFIICLLSQATILNEYMTMIKKFKHTVYNICFMFPPYLSIYHTLLQLWTYGKDGEWVCLLHQFHKIPTSVFIWLLRMLIVFRSVHTWFNLLSATNLLFFLYVKIIVTNQSGAWSIGHHKLFTIGEFISSPFCMHIDALMHKYEPMH